MRLRIFWTSVSISLCSFSISLLLHTTATPNSITAIDRINIAIKIVIIIFFSSLSTTSGYVFFPVEPDTRLPESNILSFEVHTNRGVIDRIALQLPVANLVPMEDN